jgi:hypothetical protein
MPLQKPRYLRVFRTQAHPCPTNVVAGATVLLQQQRFFSPKCPTLGAIVHLTPVRTKTKVAKALQMHALATLRSGATQMWAFAGKTQNQPKPALLRNLRRTYG